ncbi:sensor domain-containing diguanylate cyclase [Pelagibacterium limicola]|uniref:sensor domain-containing diguanylate cyclase n=1 Tax=Pelagibacterium limicola TaxID=2791022 RepID=UPI0018AFB6A7|nr:sensor domain-containing diguanylate cyclase [Pelagibacterium limicola]
MAIEQDTGEEGRIAALFRHGIPGVNADDALDRIVKIARAALGVPIGAVTAVERNRQSFLALRGLDDAPLPLDQSFCARAVTDNKTLIVPDATAEERFSQFELVKGKAGVRAYMGVPVVSADGYPLGTVCVMDTQPRAFSEDDVTVLVNLARLAASHLATRQSESFDFVTGANTRRRFQMDVEREFDRAVRYDRPACLVFVDLDNFAQVNEAVGPEMADEVLKAIANRCREALRSTDVFGRIGGEEFGMLLPETLAYEASQCAERLRETIAKLRFRAGGEVVSITASFGVAPLNPAIKSAVHWFAQADMAVMTAKRAGRDCVAFAPPTEDAPVGLDEAHEEAAAARLH